MAAVVREERISVRLEADVMRARRLVREMAAGLGFDEQKTADLETAVSELATNLVQHRAVGGETVLSVIEGERGKGIEVRVEDRGPGIRDLSSALRGGESTAGSLGIGLSGVRRLMDEFSIDSGPGRGTMVMARKWLAGEAGADMDMDFSVFSRPKPGEDVSGDAYYIKRFSHSVIFSVIDALGHGREAHETALVALRVLEESYSEPLARIVELAHKALLPTRGAAMALCKVNFKDMRLDHLSIGNVETRVYGPPEPVRPFCYNGTLGMCMESYRVIEYPYARDALIVMFSDGISGRFDLDARQLAMRPQEIGAHIFREYARQTDDATVLVGR